jgi:hypothetical protein
MRRRLTVLFTVVCVAALGVTAVALAHGGGGKDPERGTTRTTPVKPQDAGGGPAGFFGRGLFGVVLDSLAGRLDVKPADLRKAVGAVIAEQRDKRLQAAGLTPAEIDALKACGRGHGHGFRGADGTLTKRDPTRVPRARRSTAACDTDAAKSAIAKLRAAANAKPDLVALKADLAQSLATKLGKTPDQILAAVRAELDARLTQAVTIGLVTQKGHDLALACFDAPATCDLTALKAEIKFPGHRAGGKGDRHDGRPHGHHRLR